MNQETKKKMELKPCPFCGGEAKRQRFSDNLIDMIECSNCTTGVVGNHKMTAIQAWNNRKSVRRSKGLTN